MNSVYLVEIDEGYEGTRLVAVFSSEEEANVAKARIVEFEGQDADYVYVSAETVWEGGDIVTQHWSAWVRDGVLLVNKQGYPEPMETPVEYSGTVHVWADTEAEARVIAENMLRTKEGSN